MHHGDLDLDTMLPINKKGQFIHFGYRLCGKQECVNPEHVTTSIREVRAKGLRPRPLFHKRHDITFEQLCKYARNIEPGAPKPETCSVPGCNNKHRAMMLCNGHHLKFTRWRKERGIKVKRLSLDITPVLEAIQPPIGSNNLKPRDRFCHVRGCIDEYHGRGLCKKHLSRYEKHIKKIRTATQTKATHA
jgi:hypothetical protein